MIGSAPGLGRIFLFYELIKEVRGLVEPTSVLHLKKEISSGKELLLTLIRVAERFQTAFLGQISNSVVRRFEQFGNVSFGQTLVESLRINTAVIKCDQEGDRTKSTR